MKHFTDVFEQPNSKKGRLLINDQPVGGLKLAENLHEYGLQNGQLIFVEFLEANNTWPTDVYKAAQKAKGQNDKDSAPG